jgi:hypothetical protein
MKRHRTEKNVRLKAPMNFTRRTRTAVLVTLAPVLATTGALRAADGPSPATPTITTEAVTQDSAAQAAIRGQSDQIRQTLLQLVQELRQNGLPSSDAAILSTVAAHLSSLDAGDMQKVMEALRGAAAATDDLGRERSLVSAYQDQKTVALRLQALAAELAAEETNSGLTMQLEKLIERQSANLRRTEVLARDRRPVQKLNEREQALHTMAAAEQANIGGGVDQELAAVTAAAAALADSPDAALDHAVMDAAQALPLKDTAAAATQLSQGGPFPDALEQESTLRQDLDQLLQAALSGHDALTRLEQAQAELDRLIGSQQDLVAASKQDLVAGETLAENEREIDDRSQVALALLHSLNPAAIERLVTNTLTEAQKLLAGQIADAQAAEKDPTSLDALALAQQLQQEVQQAQRTAATQPEQTADALRNMQQETFAVSPEAAAHLADAADNLQPAMAKKNETPNLNQVPNTSQAHASTRPAQPQTPGATPPPAANPNAPQGPAQAAAAQDLAKANDALQQKINALTPSAQQAAALAQAQQKIDQAQEEASQAAQNIQPSTPTQPADVPRDLTDAAQKAAQAEQSAQAAGTPTAAANAALQQAANDLKNGSQQAVQGDPAGAKASAQQGMAALQQAKSALGQAMGQLQAQNQQQPTQGQLPAQENLSALGGVAPQDTPGLLAGSGPQGGPAQVVGALSPKDRAAITQYQEEKAPPEYAPAVQQYLKNLADYQRTP